MKRKEYEEQVQADIAWIEAGESEMLSSEAEHVIQVLKESVDLKFPPQLPIPVWLAGNRFEQEWKDYLALRTHRKIASSPVWQKRCFENLMALSGGNAETATAIVKQSSDNGWQGLFALKRGIVNSQRRW